MGLISQIQRFSTEDGPGIRTTVFFQGCNLFCPWCHNPETIKREPTLLFYEMKCVGCRECEHVCPTKSHKFLPKHTIERQSCIGCGDCVQSCLYSALSLSGIKMSAEEIWQKIWADKDFYFESKGGVTLSGGEPLLQADFCAQIAKKCFENKIDVIIDTAACVDFSEFEKVMPYVNTFFVDFKLSNEKSYKEICGGSLELVKSNAKRLISQGKKVVARVPVIPDINDSEESLELIKKAIEECGIEHTDFLNFHSLGASKYKALGLKYRFE
ncbi:MAG: glycyl-radical enzyme activating protein [Ruminococcaceae bacterium]|nr:glycyl-radical enzyme activating protein [Oscillospiraceae bacterium]